MLIHPHHISVTEFSKQTGDYASLSAVDLRVMALTYELEKEHCGIEHINTKPNREVGAANVRGLYFKQNFILVRWANVDYYPTK
jgi:rRNA maturation endonuclease Nob1